jgi:hypothetical protein
MGTDEKRDVVPNTTGQMERERGGDAHWQRNEAREVAPMVETSVGWTVVGRRRREKGVRENEKLATHRSLRYKYGKSTRR